VRDDATLLHLDLDAFFASVEQRDEPRLRGRPVIVGGTADRGVVAAASYEARAFGVHSAMPSVRARRLCPDAVFVAPRFDAYEAASREVMTIMRSVTPLVEPLSLDEAFMDVAGSRRIHGEPATIADHLRTRIRAEVGLTASVGGATTKMLAKIASDLAKPDGVRIVEPGTELAVLHPLPVRRLWGVGPATHQRLERFGVVTIGDLAALPRATLVAALGEGAGGQLHDLAWNRDERAVEPGRGVKSIGHEETFSVDRTERGDLERELHRMVDRVATRLRAAGLVGRTVQVKVRYPDFRTVTRAHTVEVATDLAAEIGAVARTLLAGLDLGDGVRLLGVSVSGLRDAGGETEQLSFAAPDAVEVRAERRALELAVDAVRERFGSDALGSAAHTDRGRLRTGRAGSQYGPLADGAPDVAPGDGHRDHGSGNG
jgi:DNA polymerase-4